MLRLRGCPRRHVDDEKMKLVTAKKKKRTIKRIEQATRDLPRLESARWAVDCQHASAAHTATRPPGCEGFWVRPCWLWKVVLRESHAASAVRVVGRGGHGGHQRPRAAHWRLDPSQASLVPGPARALAGGPFAGSEPRASCKTPQETPRWLAPGKQPEFYEQQELWETFYSCRLEHNFRHSDYPRLGQCCLDLRCCMSEPRVGSSMRRRRPHNHRFASPTSRCHQRITLLLARKRNCRKTLQHGLIQALIKLHKLHYSTAEKYVPYFFLLPSSRPSRWLASVSPG
jgi:hypothetical protein